MNRSKGTYIQGVKYAESLLEKSLEAGEDPSERFRQVLRTESEPSYYYDGKDYCEGFYDYVHYFLDNKELIVNHFKGEDNDGENETGREKFQKHNKAQSVTKIYGVLN